VRPQSCFIVFEKLAEARRTGGITEAEVAESARLQAEAEEIAELRRVVSEITEPLQDFGRQPSKQQTDSSHDSPRLDNERRLGSSLIVTHVEGCEEVTAARNPCCKHGKILRVSLSSQVLGNRRGCLRHNMNGGGKDLSER